ncbi:thioredoxin domain-containing protein 3 homolog [Pomacea canaliculata]|uniref:thioredoxin domain-containing protein 3 homolog n=1 Tax=Pomacea canaliculata TaxID=400727 RepID=UPI000D73B3B4|nr:thioredoxin domain-containing protein 3 homolog [Pomacea canaliculata]
MPPKKKETPLYQEVNSQKDWESLLEQKGLFVVDVYQEWSGPCNALSGHFRRIMIELSDKLLQFAIAKVDNTEALKDYRGKCEPCFLFYAEGMLVAFVHGANVPLIINTIKKQLDFEHKVLEGLEVRKEVQDVFIIAKYRKERQATRASKIEIRILQTEETAPQSFTVAIIKPNVVENRKVNDIFMELKEHNIHIMVEEERLLTEEEAKIFYDCKKDEAFFEDLIKFMTSGPCHVLVLTKEQIFDEVIYDWQHLMGPPNVEEAKDKAPNSLRARYGKQGIMNGLHGSENRRAAARELDFFFPTFKVPIIQGKRVQRTLAILRPDVFNEKKDEVLQTIKEAGFQIPLQKVVHLTEKQAEEFYSESNYQPFFGNLTDYMSSNPILALVLARSDAINRWQNLLGPQSLDEAMIAAPESLRAKYAFDGIPFNQLHGSDSEESAKKEICFFFPTETTLAVIKPDAYPHKVIHQSSWYWLEK